MHRITIFAMEDGSNRRADGLIGEGAGQSVAEVGMGTTEAGMTMEVGWPATQETGTTMGTDTQVPFPNPALRP